MTFDLNEGHHHVKLAPAVLLTKFGSPRALFNVFDPRGPRGPQTPYPCKTFVATPIYMLLTKFDTILDGLRVIPENIGWATCMKNIGRREAESDIFHTCSESNIFRFHLKEAIQYLHYYVSESDLNKCMKNTHFCLPNDSKFLFQVHYCPNNL